MSRFPKKVELVANVAIIVVSILLGVVLITRFVFNRPLFTERAVLDNIKVGTSMALPGVNWSEKNHHLILVLQKDCRFCEQSAPFYQRLIQQTAGRNDLQMIAVLPQDVDDSKKYLNDLGVSISNVKQVSPSSLGVRGTPTLILVNDTGVITHTWFGKLPPEKESEVLRDVIGIVSSKE